MPSSAELAITDPDFKFPQVWRSNIAVDQKLPFGFIGTVEFIYTQDINGITYYNANLPAPQSGFAGPDGRPRWTSNRLNSYATSAEVLTNTNEGYSQSFSVKLEKTLVKGFSGMAAYNFGRAKNVIDPGSIARGTWTNNPVEIDANNPYLRYSSNDQRHRAIAALNYRKEYAGFGATQVSLFWEGRNQGRFSYTYSNDMNGDGGFGDLMYIPRNTSEMFFETYTPSGASAPYTAAQQATDWSNYIAQDEYLSANQGTIAERNAAIFPWVFRADFSIAQEFYIEAGGKRNTLQLRFDIFNVGNLLNDGWGVGNTLANNRALQYRSVNAQGQPVFRLTPLSVTNGQIVPVTETFISGTTLADVWQAQLGIRYIFN